MTDYFPKSQFDAGHFPDFESFMFFMLGKKYYEYDAVCFKGDIKIFGQIMSTLLGMEENNCFAIKKHTMENYTAYFLLENIDKHSLEKYFSKKNYFEQKSYGLKNEKLTLNEAKFILEGRTNKVKLIPDTDEYYLCRVMFGYEINQPEDWLTVFEKMKDDIGIDMDKISIRKDKKSIRDTKNRLNKKVKEVFKTDENLLSFTGNNIKRNF